MSFMQMEIYKDRVFEVENSWHETYYVPESVCGNLPQNPEDFKDYVIGTPVKVTLLTERWVGRMSAPGYMDCTDWYCDTNKRNLIRTLRDNYGK